MPNPTPYALSYSFTGFQASDPSRPLPAQRIDIEFQNLQLTTGEIIAALAQVRRSDGKLANASVDLAALSDEVIRELGGAGAGSGDGVIFATKAQAEAGTSNGVVMSPLRVKEAIAVFAGDGGGGTVPGGPIDIDDVTGLTDALAGKSNTGHTHSIGQVGGLTDALNSKQATLGFTPEDRVNRGQPGGYASLDGTGKVPAAQLPTASSGSTDAKDIIFRPDGFPSLAIPVSDRLGAEVYLTDGYVVGSNLTDFSDLIDANLSQAVARKRPFIIPHGLFKANRQFAIDNTGIMVSGMGKTLSAIQWTADAASTGLRVIASDQKSKPDFMHFRDLALYTEKQAEGEAIYASFEKQIVPNNGNPVIVNRWSTRFRAQDVTIEGLGNAKAGWLKGITCLYEIDAILRDVQFRGSIDGAEPKYLSEWAFYIGSADGSGYGHPTGPFVDTCNVFHAKRAVILVGNEGGVVTNSQLVGVRVGVDFVDRDGRPLLMLTNNHINAYDVCCRVNAAQQFQAIGNSFYHTGGIGDAGQYGDGIGIAIGSSTARTRDFIVTGNVFAGGMDPSKKFTGVVVYGGDNGIVDDNSFISALIGTGQRNVKAITLGSDSKHIRVGPGNITEYPGSGRDPCISPAIEDGGQNNLVPGMCHRMAMSSGQGLSPGSLNILYFQIVTEKVGNMPGSPDGSVFVIPTDGEYEISAGAVMDGGSTGSVNLNIQLNATQGNPITSNTNFYDAGYAVSMEVRRRMTFRAGDQLRVGVNPSSSRTVQVHAGTVFDIRRLA